VTEPFYLASHAAGLVLDVSVVAFAVGELQQTIRVHRRGSRSFWRDELVFRVMFFAGIVALVSCAHLFPFANVGGAAVFIVGVILLWLGMLVRWWCFVTLGRFFTTEVKTSANQPIIDRGPYRLVRHPSYSGLIVAFIGCGLMLGNWAATAIAAVIVTAALIYRISHEERALMEASGPAYLDYTKGRARLLPHVW
jgi:protein-S-isoprenylcysteine O-methyltransferase Ste14